MAKVNDYLNKNIFGNWKLFTYDIDMYSQDIWGRIPFVSYLSRDSKDNKNLAGEDSEKNCCKGLENTVRNNEGRLTNARTKQ